MKNLLILITSILLFCSCEKAFLGKDVADNPEEVFNSLWETADKKYSFFVVKGIDWNAMKVKYEPQIQNGMSDDELFDVCENMLNELKDGHVNIFSDFRTSFNDPVFYDVPKNYDDRVIYDNYVDEFYHTGPFTWGEIDTLGKTFGYIYYGAFTGVYTEDQLEYMFEKLAHTDGLVVDIRMNGGGLLSMVEPLASYLTTKNTHVYTSFVKTGEGHDEFDDGTKVEFKPADDYYTKPVALLTNRFTYSAATMFSSTCKSLDNVILVGDTTGGGGGVPAGFQLPNGWNYRFSATKTELPDGTDVEAGVIPDFPVWMTAAEIAAGTDAILDKALMELAN